MNVVVERKEAHLGRMGVERLVGHPRNRSFVMEGAAWEEWLDDLEANGIEDPLTVRPVEAGARFQVIKGHRRLAGWRCLLERGRVSVAEVPVICREMEDGEALKELLRDNLLHEHLSPVEEGQGVRALKEDLGLSDGEVAVLISKSVEWVRTRQLLLDLGDEVLERVCRGRGAAGHLDMGTVEAILEVEAELWPQAVELVLHNDVYPEPPRAGEARQLLRQALVEPVLRARAWDGALPKVVKEWRTRLRERCLKGTRSTLQVLGVRWGDRESLRGLRVALDAVPLAETGVDAPEGLLWLHVAVRHGLNVMVLPEASGPGSVAVVQEPVLRQLEEALGAEAWVGRRKRGAGSGERGESVGGEGLRQDATATERAVAGLEGEPEPAWVAEEERRPEAVVVEQVVESHALVDLGPVRRLREWAVKVEEDPEFGADLPDWLPGWSLTIYAEELIGICDWVLGLKRRGPEGG